MATKLPVIHCGMDGQVETLAGTVAEGAREGV
jgi:hypothetical protein